MPPHASSTVQNVHVYRQLYRMSMCIVNCTECPCVSSTVQNIHMYCQMYRMSMCIVNCTEYPYVSSTVQHVDMLSTVQHVHMHCQLYVQHGHMYCSTVPQMHTIFFDSAISFHMYSSCSEHIIVFLCTQTSASPRPVTSCTTTCGKWWSATTLLRLWCMTLKQDKLSPNSTVLYPMVSWSSVVTIFSVDSV